MTMRDEILEQPEVARRLLDRGREAVESVAAAATARGANSVVVAARGSSDHAAIFAQYVLGVRNRLPVALAAPSILSIYGAAPRFMDSLVVGVSQSGASPDIVGVIAEAREQGAVTVAVTNDQASPLAERAEYSLDLGAGPERSIAATKTYTAQLLTLAMLSAALEREARAWTDLATIPDLLAVSLAAEDEVERIAAATATMERCIVLGRGFEYATAREWSLKLKELTYVPADPYSAADFEHGPLALLEPGLAVLALAPDGLAAPGMIEMIERVRAVGARTLVLSDRSDIRDVGDDALVLPMGVPEWLSPITSAVVVQLHAYHLARAKGLDPETPRHLRKVTETT